MRRKLLDIITDLIFPPKCAACGDITASREALCSSCLERYAAETRTACAVCALPASRCTCGGIDAVYLTFYKGYYSLEDRVTEKLIFALKHKRSIPLADFFARDISSEIMKRTALRSEKKSDYILTHLPRGERNFKKYGFDHGALLCGRVSRYTGISEACLFVRRGGEEQKKMDYRERMDNANDTLDLSADADVAGRRIILIDDIITTGATVKRAEELLYSHGAAEVMCAVIAKTAAKRGHG